MTETNSTNSSYTPSCQRSVYERLGYLLSPSSLNQFHIYLIKNGSLKDVCILYVHFKHILEFQNITEIYQCLQSIPLCLDANITETESSRKTASIEEYNEWLHQCLLNYIFYIANNTLSLTSTTTTHNTATDTQSVSQSVILTIIDILNHLCKVARDIEEYDRHPFQALWITDVSSIIINKIILGSSNSNNTNNNNNKSTFFECGTLFWPKPQFEYLNNHIRLNLLFPTTSQNSTDSKNENEPINLNQEIVTKLKKILLLNFHLYVQKEIWFSWMDKIRLDEVEDYGLQGVIFNYFNILPLDMYAENIQLYLLPFLSIFHISLDDAINDWIRNALHTKFIVCDKNDMNYDQDINNISISSGKSPIRTGHKNTTIYFPDEGKSLNDSMMSTSTTGQGMQSEDDILELSRVNNILQLVHNIQLKAQIILLLLQLPAVNKRAISMLKNSNQHHHKSNSAPANSNNNDEDDEEDDNATPNTTNANNNINTAVSELCTLAHTICSEITNIHLKESLIEALRLQRIRSIVSSYNIEYIDSRNYRHIRAVASIIAARIKSPTAITDALELVQAWR